MKDQGKGELDIIIKEIDTLKSEKNKTKKDLKEMTEENIILREENNKLKLELDNYKQSRINFIASFDSGNLSYFKSKNIKQN